MATSLRAIICWLRNTSTIASYVSGDSVKVHQIVAAALGSREAARSSVRRGGVSLIDMERNVPVDHLLALDVHLRP